MVRKGGPTLFMARMAAVVLAIACAIVMLPASASAEEATTSTQATQQTNPSTEAAVPDSAADSTSTDSTSSVKIDSPAEPIVTTMNVSVRFVGLDGEWATFDELTLDKGANAWQATATALAQSTLFYQTGLYTSRDVLVSLSQSLDGEALSLDTSTGDGWHLYVNDVRCLEAADTIVLADGDVVEWRYEKRTIDVTVSVVGPGGTGDSFWITPQRVSLEASQGAWDAMLRVLKDQGYEEGRLFSYTTNEDGSVTLDSLAALGENGITGELWQGFLNGVPEPNLTTVELRDGDAICWYYTGRGSIALPSFVAASGGGQNPAATVWTAGTVRQVWEYPTVADDGILTELPRGSGLSLSGDARLTSLVQTSTKLISPLRRVAWLGAWGQSLSRVLNDVVNTGMGGQACLGANGHVYYISDAGTVINLMME